MPSLGGGSAGEAEERRAAVASQLAAFRKFDHQGCFSVLLSC